MTLGDPWPCIFGKFWKLVISFEAVRLNSLGVRLACRNYVASIRPRMTNHSQRGQVTWPIFKFLGSWPIFGMSKVIYLQLWCTIWLWRVLTMQNKLQSHNFSLIHTFDEEIKSYIIDCVLDTHILTHPYVIDLRSPEYTNCHQLRSFRHILTEWSCYNQTRQQYYMHTNLKDIFSHIPIKSVLDFINNVNLCDNL